MPPQPILAFAAALLAALARAQPASLPPADALAALSLIPADGLATTGPAGGVAAGAASPWTSLSSQLVSYPLTQATTLAAGSYLSRPAAAAAPAPPLPTGFAPRSLSAWVKCDAPAVAGSPGRTILDLSDGSSSIFTEHFAVLGAGAGAPAAISTPQYNTSSFAGVGCGAFADGAIATGAGKLGTAYSIKVARDGTVFFVDRAYNSVRKVTPAGDVRTIAGLATQAAGAADGLATASSFNAPFGLVLNNAQDKIFIADYSNNKVRQVLVSNGTTTSICGAGGSGYIDGPQSAAKFTSIQYVTVDKSDVMYISENLRLRVCNLTSGNGNVSTFAGTGVAGTSFDGPLNGSLGLIGTNAPRGMAFDPTGRFFYWVDYSGCKLRMADLLLGVTSTPAGTPGVAPPATCASTNGFGSSANFFNPVDMAADAVGNLYVMDVNGRRLRKVSPAGMVTTIIGSGASGGNAAGVGTNAAIGAPGGVGVDQLTGDVYMGDTLNCKIWKGVAPKQTISLAAPVCDGSWHSVVATLTNTSAAALYVDGALVASASAVVANTALGAAPVLGIGGAPGAAELFSGAIADVRVFDRALAAAEALALFRPPMPVFPNATLSPNPSTAPASTTTFTYSCDAGFIGATVTVTRGAGGAWSSSGPVSCTKCLAGTFSLPGGVQCITIPTLPVYALASWTPAVSAAGITTYVASCTQPGAAGPTRNFSYVAASNSFEFSGPVQCTACSAATEFSLAPAAGGGAGFQCRACSSVSAGLTVASAVLGYAGGLQCACRDNFFSSGALLGPEAALACTACPTGSTANGSAATCTCKEHYFATGTGVSLNCACLAGYTPTGSGSSAICIPVTPSPSPTSSASFSSSTTPTPSVTPTISATSTSSLSATPSTTPSLSATPTSSATPSKTSTPSNTPTPSQTPSVTTVPDVVVYFNMTIVSSQGPVTASYVASSAGATFLRESAAAFARTLVVPAANVYAVTVTDVATGQAFQVGSLRRALAGAGSLGAAVTFVVRLGKTPTQTQVLNISNTLSSPAAISGALTASASSFAAATGVDVRGLSAVVPPRSVSVANAPFSLTAPAAAAASGADSGASSTGGIVGGIIAALALACAIWGARSYAKHGKLPCFRDRRKEIFYRREEKAEQDLVASAIAEAEAALEVAHAGADAASKPAVVARPSKPKPKGADAALVVRKLSQKSAAAEAAAAAAVAEVAELKRQLAAAQQGTAPRRAAFEPTEAGETETANPAFAAK